MKGDGMKQKYYLKLDYKIILPMAIASWLLVVLTCWFVMKVMMKVMV
jgi:hypothetical protein